MPLGPNWTPLSWLQANVAVTTLATVPLEGMSWGVAVTSSTPTPGAVKPMLSLPRLTPPAPLLPGAATNETLTAAPPLLRFPVALQFDGELRQAAIGLAIVKSTKTQPL